MTFTYRTVYERSSNNDETKSESDSDNEDSDGQDDGTNRYKVVDHGGWRWPTSPPDLG